MFYQFLLLLLLYSPILALLQCSNSDQSVCDSGLCFDSINVRDGRIDSGCSIDDICPSTGCNLIEQHFVCCCQHSFCNGKSRGLLHARYRGWQMQHTKPDLMPSDQGRNASKNPRRQEPIDHVFTPRTDSAVVAKPETPPPHIIQSILPPVTTSINSQQSANKTRYNPTTTTPTTIASTTPTTIASTTPTTIASTTRSNTTTTLLTTSTTAKLSSTSASNPITTAAHPLLFNVSSISRHTDSRIDSKQTESVRVAAKMRPSSGFPWIVAASISLLVIVFSCISIIFIVREKKRQMPPPPPPLIKYSEQATNEQLCNSQPLLL